MSALENSADVPRIPFPKEKIPRRIALEELAILESRYPHAVTALRYDSEFQLLVAVILSAQCTDARVNMTTPALFSKYPTAEKLALARQSDVEKIIKSCGFFRMKAKNIIACARERDGAVRWRVPHEREDLESLAGVGRKTASVVMAAAFSAEALAVDTHVFRVAHRLGLTTGTTPRQVEEDLTAFVPPQEMGRCHTLADHAWPSSLQSPDAALLPLSGQRALPHATNYQKDGFPYGTARFPRGSGSIATRRALRSRRRGLVTRSVGAENNWERGRSGSAQTFAPAARS